MTKIILKKMADTFLIYRPCVTKVIFIYLLGRDIIGTVTLKQIYEIALIKSEDRGFKNTPLEGVCKCLIHSCHSMGINVVNDRTNQGEETSTQSVAAS